MQPKDTKKPVILRTVPEERRDRPDRRVTPKDRRCGADRRVRNKFVLFDRRKGTGRRILARGRRYCLDRRNAVRKPFRN